MEGEYYESQDWDTRNLVVTYWLNRPMKPTLITNQDGRLHVRVPPRDGGGQLREGGRLWPHRAQLRRGQLHALQEQGRRQIVSLSQLDFYQDPGPVLQFDPFSKEGIKFCSIA